MITNNIKLLKNFHSYLDDLLKISEIPDVSLNGVQVGDLNQEIKKIALAVDSNLLTLQRAVAKKADLLLVHHGLFWGKPFAFTKANYQKMQILIQNKMGLYAIHLPLDLHQPLGNNYQIATQLGLEYIQPFGQYHGRTIGFLGHFKGNLKDLEKKCLSLSDTCQFLTHQNLQKEELGIAVVSGKGGTGILEDFIDSNCDVLITGETEHALVNTLLDAQKNMITLGHYQSEKFGVIALGEYLTKKFGIETFFIEQPTGY